MSYYDAAGKRQRKNFTTKGAADAERIRIEAQLQSGTHVADRDSDTVIAACRAWLNHIEDLVKLGKRERQTLRPYTNHVELYIAPAPIAAMKLSRLTTPAVQIFVDGLQGQVSDPMLVKILKSLRMALTFAQRRGALSGNPASAAKIERGDDRDDDEVVIPTKDELRRILMAAQLLDAAGVTTYAEPLITLKLFSGLRISELRGLTKPQLTIAGSNSFQVKVTQRADERGMLGRPKSKAGRRTVPLGSQTIAVLRQWFERLAEIQKKATRHRPEGAQATPAETLHLVFPNGAGKIESYANLYHRVWTPACIVAGVVANPEAPKASQRPLYGLHALRHAAASIWIEQGLLPKVVQHRMGHNSLQMAMDLYGHLWPDPGADASAADRAEKLILG